MNAKRMIVIGLCMLAGGCATFPTSYERVGEGEIRVLDFSYEPAEAAPGDSVTLRALIAGEQIENVEWYVSYNVITNLYGTETMVDYEPLQYETVACSSMPHAACISIKFKVPDNMLRRSDNVPDNWIEAFPVAVRQFIPDSIAGLSKGEMLDALELFAQQGPVWDSIVFADPGKVDSLNSDPQFRMFQREFTPMAAPVLQAFSARIMIHAKVDGYPDVRSPYTVRYNSKLAGIPGIYTNANPEIERVGIYKVAKDLLTKFDPRNSEGVSFETLVLFDRTNTTLETDTVVVDKGYSYFFWAESDTPDSSLNLFQAGIGSSADNQRVEKHLYKWFFQLPQSQVEEAHSDELMDIVNSWDAPIVKLNPPMSASITSFVLWVQVYDEFMNERLRPIGSSVTETSCAISYTEEYLGSIGN